MSLKNKIEKIILNIIPILLMIGLIPIIWNDYILTLVYIVIISVSFYLKREKGDMIIFLFGFFAMILSEMVFISTGVEVFVRDTLFGLMPLWLPFLWGYGFVVINRGINILGFKNKKRPEACVGVMVFNKEGKILLGKRCGRHAPGEYSMPGGRIEYMESFKDSIEREVLEEAGIKIKDLKFLNVANINRYEYRHDVSVHFTALLDLGEPKTDPKERIKDWGWYDINNLPEPLFYPSKLVVESYKSGKNYYDQEKI